MEQPEVLTLPAVSTVTDNSWNSETKLAEVTPSIEELGFVEPRLIEWEKIELEIDGKPMEFVIGKEEGANTENKWGIVSLNINENLENVKEKFSKMISGSFWQIYKIQSFSDITYEEFLQTPNEFKIGLTSPAGNGGFQSAVFSLDQITKFEWRFINVNDERLYFDPTSEGTIRFGYKFKEDGTFILYGSWPENEGSFDGIFSDQYPANGEPQYAAGMVFGDVFFIGLYGIINTRELGSPISLEMHRGEFVILANNVKELSGYPTLDEVLVGSGGNMPSVVDPYLKKFGFWKITIE